MHRSHAGPQAPLVRLPCPTPSAKGRLCSLVNRPGMEFSCAESQKHRHEMRQCYLVARHADVPRGELVPIRHYTDGNVPMGVSPIVFSNVAIMRVRGLVTPLRMQRRLCPCLSGIFARKSRNRIREGSVQRSRM